MVWKSYCLHTLFFYFYTRSLNFDFLSFFDQPSLCLNNDAQFLVGFYHTLYTSFFLFLSYTSIKMNGFGKLGSRGDATEAYFFFSF